MNAQQLKNSILQEAIEGRLVPQDPNDEPASVLLDKIRAEKKRLVKEGKLKKKDLEEIPISEDEKPFEIPKGWVWVRLLTLCKNIHYGYTASASPIGNCKLLRITDIQDDKVNWSSVPFCSIKEKDLETYKLHNRDILIARTGGTVGKTFIVRELNDIAVFASYLIRAIPSDYLFEEYIKLFMGSPYYWSQLTDAATGTGQPNVNGQSLSKLILPLPPLAEQHRIVAKIEELLPKVEEYGKAQEELNKLNEELPERLKKSILQEANSGRLVPQDPIDEPASVLLERIRAEKKRLVKEGKLKKKDLEETPISEDEIPFKIPESWEWCKIENITISIGNKTNQIQTKEIQNEGKVPVVSQGQKLIDGYSNEVEKTIHELPLVMFGDHTRNVKLIDFPFVIGADGTKFFKPILCNPKYIYYVVFYISSKLRNRGYARHYSLLKEEVFPLPPLSEQHRIVAKIEQLMKEIDKLKG